MKERLSEQQELIADLEARLKERNDTLQHDKHKYVSEIKHLRNEVSSRTERMVYIMQSKYFHIRIVSKLVPVVQRLDSAVHQINRYPVDKC